jgi:putative autoinducer-2 (AI-2) aldolase
MADIQTSAADKKEKEFFTHIPQEAPGFFLKGCHQYDWGLKNRLSKVFNPKDGRTVMLAFDHGYFQGPTTGLERVDQTILPLAPTPTASCSPVAFSAASFQLPRRRPSPCVHPAAPR